MHELRSAILTGDVKSALDPTARKEACRRGGGLSLIDIAIPREERRSTDQRREDRYHGVVERATITFRRKKSLVKVVNVSAGGFIAEVSDAVNPQLKTIAGKLAYLIGGAQVVLSYQPVRAQILRVGSAAPPAASAVNQPLSSTIPLHAFAVCNSRLVGGGRLIAPHATIDDGRLDVCLIEAMPTVEFLGLLRRVSDGEHVDDERVSYFQASGLELIFDRVIKVNTDGQVLETDRCRYDVLPRAARFLRGRASEIFQ